MTKGVGGLLLRQRQCLGAWRRSVRHGDGSGFEHRRRLQREPGGALHRRHRLAARQRHRRGCGRDLRGKLGEVQGRVEHRCELVSRRGLCRLGWRAMVCLGSAVVSFNDFSTSRLLTPFGLPGDATSSPSARATRAMRKPDIIGSSGRRRECLRHALRRLGLRERPYLRLFRDGRLRRAFGERRRLNSFQTTLGVCLTSRIALGNYGVPRLSCASAGSSNLDAAQSLSASLTGVARSASPRPASRLAATPPHRRRLQRGALPRRQGLRRLRR